jgi:hypothetical protein
MQIQDSAERVIVGVHIPACTSALERRLKASLSLSLMKKGAVVHRR